MNENKNGQAVQSKPADQQIKGNNVTVPNPKNEVMTPEKIKDPVVDKGNEQIGGVKKQQENKDSKAPVVEQKSSMQEGQKIQSNPTTRLNDKNNVNASDLKKDVNASEKTKTPIQNKEEVEEEIGYDEEQEKNERSEKDKAPVAEQKKSVPVV
jgi:hypothetical protein